MEMENQLDIKQVSLSTLNDDCLLHIFAQLDERNHMKMRKVCRHFRHIIENQVFNRCKTLHLYRFKDWTMQEIHEYISLVGSHVLKIQSCPPWLYDDNMLNISLEIAECIREFCPNNEEILVSGCDTVCLEKLIKHKTHITSISLRNFKICDADILLLGQLPNLQYFKLYQNEIIEGTHLHVLNHLTELVLASCFALRDEHFIAVCKSVRQTLKKLDIREVCLSQRALNEGINYCEQLKWLKVPNLFTITIQVPQLKGLQTDSLEPLEWYFIPTVAKYQAHCLEVLYIDDLMSIQSNVLGYIAQMRKLRRLRLCPYADVTDACLRKLQVLSLLECIELLYADKITNAGVLHLIQQCTRLRLIELRGCKAVTENIVFEIIEWLLTQQQRQDDKRILPLYMILDPRDVKRTLLSEVNHVKNAASVLKLYFIGDRYDTEFRRKLVEYKNFG